MRILQTSKQHAPTILLACLLALCGVAPSLRAADPTTDKPQDDPLPKGARARLGSPRLVHLRPEILSVQMDPSSLMTFSSDSHQLITASSDGRVRFWDTKTGRQLLHMDPPSDAVLDADAPYCTGISLTQDGKVLGLCVPDKGIMLYDAATAKHLRTIGPSLPKYFGAYFTFSPDGKQAAVTGFDKDDTSIHIYNTESGKELQKLEGHAKQVNCVEYSADGKKLATSSDDQSVRLWNLETGKTIRTFEGHRAAVQWLAISADAKRIASLGNDRTIRIWDTENGSHLKADLATNDNWSLVPYGTVNTNTVLRFSPDGKILTGFLSRGLHQWDAATGKLRREPKDVEKNRFRPLAMSPDEKIIARWNNQDDGRIHLLDATTEKELLPADISSRVESLAVSPDGKYLATAGRDQFIQVWDAKTLHEVHRFDAGQGFITFLLFSPDSKVLYTKGIMFDDNPILVWDIGTGKELSPIRGDGRRLGPVGHSGDGRTLAVIASDSRDVRSSERQETTFHLFDTVSRKLQDTKLKVSSFSMYSDGSNLLIRDREGTLLHTTVERDGKDPKPLSKQTFSFDTNVCFCPDGKTAAAIDKTGEIVVFDLEAGRDIHQMGDKLERKLGNGFDRHLDRFGKTPLAIAPDGRTLASEGKDNKVIVWDVATGKKRQVFEGGHQSLITALAFTPDGKTLISAGNDGVVVLWDLTERGSGVPKGSAQDGKEDKKLERSEPAAPKDEPLPKGSLRRIGSSRLVHADAIYSIAFSADSSKIVTTGSDGLVRIWDAATGLESLHIDPRAAAKLENVEDIQIFDLARNRKKLAILVKNKGAFLFNATTGEYLRDFTDKPAGAVAISPGADVLAITGISKADPAIRLYDTASGKELKKLEGHDNIVNCLTFSQDGAQLVSGSDDLTIRLWDVKSTKQVRAYEDMRSAIMAVAISADARLVAAFSTGFEVRVWDSSTGDQLWHNGLHGVMDPQIRMRTSDGKFKYAAAAILQFSPDSKILSANLPDAIRQWEAASGKPVNESKLTGSTLLQLLSPDGKCIARMPIFRNDFGSQLFTSSSIELADTATQKPLFPQPSTGCHSIAISPDGKSLASGADNGTIRLWDTTWGKLTGQLEGHTGPVRFLFFCSDESLISASATFSDHTVSRWDLPTGKEESLLHTDGQVWSMVLSRDAGTLAWLNNNDRAGRYPAHLFDVQKRSEIGTFDTRSFRSKALALSPEGGSIIVQSKDGSFVLLKRSELQGKPEPRTLYQPARAPPYISPDGSMIAISDEDGSISLVKVATGRVWRQFGEKKLPISDRPPNDVIAPLVAFSPDGRFLATAAKAAPIMVWELASGKTCLEFGGVTEPSANQLVFTPDSRTLVSSSLDGQIMFWDVANISDEDQKKAAKLQDKDLQDLWKTLAGDDAVKAHETIRLLRAAKATTSFLKDNLPPAEKIDPKKLDRWIADLENEDFDTRAAAQKELERAGTQAEQALRRALDEKPALEKTKRIEEILQNIEAQLLTGEDLRSHRAIHLLELIATDDAKDLLKKLATGAESAILTREAKAALARVSSVKKKE